MFNETIVRHFSNPTHAAELDDASCAIELGNPVCGDRIRIHLQLEGGFIEKARYQAWGCATSLATGNAFCEFIERKPLAVAAATRAEQVAALLGELEPSQAHCLEMLRTLFDKLRTNAESAAS